MQLSPDCMSFILAEMAEGLLVLDGEGRFQYINAAGRAVLSDVGVDPGDPVLRRRWDEVLPDLPGTELGRAFQEVLDGGSGADFRLHRGPGDEWWDVSIRPLEDGLFATFKNVTEALLRPETLDAFFRTYPHGALVVFGGDLRYHYVGGQGFESLDISPEDLVGHTLHELWEPELVRTLEPAFRAALEGSSAEVRVEYAGREYFCHTGPLPPHPETGSRGMLLTQEVTESRLHLQELELVRKAVSALEVGVSIADARLPDHPLIFLNDGFERLTGYPVEGSLGKNCRFLQGPDTDPETVNEIRAAIEAGEGIQRALLNYRKDGTPFWNRLTINPVMDRSGSVTHFIGIQEDVTERRRLGKQLSMSDRLNSVGRLAGGIAHDMRNVIAGAKALLQLTLMREDLEEDVREDLEEAAEVLTRGESVTSQLLAFAREQPLETQVLDLGEMARGRVEFLARVLRDDIRVTAEADGPFWVEVDAGRLDQIFFNLATNAEQAMPGGGELVFQVSHVDTADLPERTASFDPQREERWVLLRVSDTGVGMDEETVAKAFDPFFTTRGEEGGTGLGLASVFGTMRQMGGGVWIDSTVGEGTCVNLALPTADAPTTPARPTEEDLQVARRSLTVLLAEDDVTVRRTLDKALSREGHRVILAPDGGSALALLDVHLDKLDIVVSDVLMPESSGVDLARAAEERRADLPVLLISGYTHEDVGGLGSNIAFLHKPFELDALLARIHRMVGES